MQTSSLLSPRKMFGTLVGALTGLKKVEPASVELTRGILADDWISPEEASHIFDVTYTSRQQAQLLRNLPGEAELWRLREQGYSLLPGPPIELTIHEMRSRNGTLFYPLCIGGCWFNNHHHTFLCTEVVPALQWLTFRKGVVPQSLDKRFLAQVTLLDRRERVPNAAELCYVVGVYQRLRGINPLGIHTLRTASSATDGCRVNVGFSDNRIHFSKSWDTYRHQRLGIAAIRA